MSVCGASCCGCTLRSCMLKALDRQADPAVSPTPLVCKARSTFVAKQAESRLSLSSKIRVVQRMIIGHLVHTLARSVVHAAVTRLR